MGDDRFVELGDTHQIIDALPVIDGDKLKITVKTNMNTFTFTPHRSTRFRPVPCCGSLSDWA